MRATRLASLLVVLGASGITCRLDKLTRPVTADRLVVSPDTLLMSANAGSSIARSRTLHLASADGVTLPWTASKRVGWLTLSRTTGGAPDSLVLSLHADTLTQGAHQDTIVFTSPEAPDTVRVAVVFDVLPPAPELAVVPASNTDSAFAGSAVVRTFVVRINNTGGVGLTWNARTDTAWLTLSRSSGSAPPLDSTIVTLTPAALAAGTHTGTVTITAPGASPPSIPVTVTFKLKPCAEPGVVADTLVSGAIALSDCGAAQRPGSQAKRYTVTASAGDTLSIRLTSPDFDAYLGLADSSGAALAQDDDCPAASGPACILNFRAPYSGRYVIEATTAASGATGAFSLSIIRERAPTVPQSLGQFRSDSVTSIAIGAVTTENVAVFGATVNDANARDSVRLEVEVVETASPFSGTPNHVSGYVGVGRTVRVGASGLTENAGYHWQARTCDKTFRCSTWLVFGANLETVPDFRVNAIAEDPVVDQVSLKQFDAQGNQVPVGGSGGDPGILGGSVTVTFRGMVTDPDPGDIIALEVESKRTNQTFDGSNLLRGASVTSGNTAQASGPHSAPTLIGQNDYQWRARACDQTGRCGAWKSFGNNGDGQTDFHVP